MLFSWTTLFLWFLQLESCDSVSANPHGLAGHSELHDIPAKTGGARGGPSYSARRDATLVSGFMAYLTARKAELLDRSIGGGRHGEDQFYQFGRSQSLSKMDGPKIILQVLSLTPRYCYDNSDTAFTGGGNGPYYMIRPKPSSGVSCFYLLAVMNHPLSEAFVRTKTSVFRGGYYSHGKQFIKDIPVPVPTQQELNSINDKVGSLLAVLGAEAAARLQQEQQDLQRLAAALAGEIEAEVSTLYGLSEADIGVLRAVPIPG
jgi:hypothetical protein